MHRTISPHMLAFAFIATTFAALVAYGVASNWVPWSDECDATPSCRLLVGESLAALENARHFAQDGPRYWYLQRHEIDIGVTMTYIHNVNVGAFVAYGTYLLGATDPAAAALAAAVAFAAGLAYAYLFVERASGSPRLALIFLVLLGTELQFSSLHGLNLLRAWHWLPLFGVAFHALVLARSPGAAPAHVVGLLALSHVGFGVGYEFFAFVVALAACTMLAYGSVRRVRPWLLLGTAFALPVAIRQFQVIGGVGLEVWATDLYFSAALKSPLLRSIMNVPPADAIAAWYREHNLFRGATNSAPVSAALTELVETGRLTWWIQELGLLTVAGAVVGLGAALVCAPLSRLVPGEMRREARSVLVVVAGQILGFAVFGYHALYYFVVRQELPMIVAPVCLALAYTVSGLVVAARRATVLRAPTVAVAALLVGERLVLQWQHLRQAGIRARPAVTDLGDFALRSAGGGNDALALASVGLVAAAVLMTTGWALVGPVRARPGAPRVGLPTPMPAD